MLDEKWLLRKRSKLLGVGGITEVDYGGYMICIIERV